MTEKKTYHKPISKCTEIGNTELICDSPFNTNDPEEMEDDDVVGSRFRGFTFEDEEYEYN